MDKEVQRKVEELCEEGVTNVREVKRHLATHVRHTEGGHIKTNNKRFYPSSRSIRNAMAKTGRKAGNTGEDQVSLEKFVRNLHSS